jgi:hypothetical protein
MERLSNPACGRGFKGAEPLSESDALTLLDKLNSYADNLAAKPYSKDKPISEGYFLFPNGYATQWEFKSNRQEGFYVIQAYIKGAVGGDKTFVYKARGNANSYIIGLNMSLVSISTPILPEFHTFEKGCPQKPEYDF